MDHRTDRAVTPPDLADLMIVEMLRAQARTEVHELASRVGLPCERVRARLRRMERAGLIRGYHARTSALAPPAPEGTVLAFVRFTGRDRPTADAIGGIAGVLRVHSLCSTWDCMVEAHESFSAAADGSGELLGCPAEFQVLPVAHVERGGRTAPRSSPDGYGRGSVAGCRSGPRG